MAHFSLVLFSPEIPGNTGSIGRTAVGLDLRLILIKPLAFSLDEKSVRRAGLDYWKYVDLTIYDSFDDFLTGESIGEHSELFFLSKTGENVLFDVSIKKSCYFIFGSETKGLPAEILSKYRSRVFSLPMYSNVIRSLNLANVATAVAYEAIRQIRIADR